MSEWKRPPTRLSSEAPDHRQPVWIKVEGEEAPVLAFYDNLNVSFYEPGPEGFFHEDVEYWRELSPPELPPNKV